MPGGIWSEALDRAAVVAPLAAEDRLTRARVCDAARTLGLSVPSAYRLIALYRQSPVTASLVPNRPGPAMGTRRLPLRVGSIVEGAIEVVHEQPDAAPREVDGDGHVRETAASWPAYRETLNSARRII